MKRMIKYIGIVLLLASATACKKDFDLINTNPNAPIDVQPSLLLRQVIYDYGEQMSYEGFVAGNLLGQHMSMTDFNLFDRHALSQPQLGGNPWPVLYKNLRDNQILLEKSQGEAIYKVYEGPAHILKAYIAMALTDIYGDVPYSEALKGLEGNTAPAYDKQEDIYLAAGGILSELDAGIAAINAYSGVQPLTGDILYSGDLTKWKKFAKSLKIKALMRISDQAGSISYDVAGNLQTLVTENDYISANTDDALFRFTASQPNSFRMQKLREGDFKQFVMSQTSDTLFSMYNDPRDLTFFRTSADANDPLNGLINGINASTTSIVAANYSLASMWFRENTADLPCNFMSAWETQFFIAEACEKGLVTGVAKTYYDAAVTNAFAYWATELPATYLTVGPGAYGTTGDNMEQIMTQKWFASFMNGYESWIEYRRTGYPALMPVSASLNNNLIPVRMPYPTDEEALNFGNYVTASSNTNGNSINVRVWWDIN